MTQPPVQVTAIATVPGWFDNLKAGSTTLMGSYHAIAVSIMHEAEISRAIVIAGGLVAIRCRRR